MQTDKLTIEVWAKLGMGENVANIDVFTLSINSLANNKKQTVNESGENGIGSLSFFYQVQLMDSIYTPTCNCTSSIPPHNSNGQSVAMSPPCISFTPTETEPYQQMSSSPTETEPYQQMSSSPTDAIFAPADNSDQQLHESCSSPWGWIAVTVLFMLLTILFFVISVAVICINRSMTRVPKGNKKGWTAENNGE